MENVDLKAIEHKVYLSYSQDGLYDILAGLVICAIGIQEMNLDATIAPFVIFIPLLFPLMKRLITLPRIGHVKFSPARNRTVMSWRILVTIAITTLVILTAAAVLVPGESSGPIIKWIWQNLMFVGGMLIALTAFIAGLITGIKRLYVYAILTWVIYGTGFALEIASWKYILTMGAIILIWGVVMLVQFIRKYQILPEQTLTGESNNAAL